MCRLSLKTSTRTRTRQLAGAHLQLPRIIINGGQQQKESHSRNTLAKRCTKFKVPLKATMRQNFSSIPTLYRPQTTEILTPMSFKKTLQLFHIKDNLIPVYLNSVMLYYKKLALVKATSKSNSHNDFRSSGKWPQLHRWEYVKPRTSVITFQHTFDEPLYYYKAASFHEKPAIQHSCYTSECA